MTLTTKTPAAENQTNGIIGDNIPPNGNSTALPQTFELPDHHPSAVRATLPLEESNQSSAQADQKEDALRLVFASASDQGHPDSDHLKAITRDDCILLLKAHGVGRLGATLRGRPLVYPVNYVVYQDTIILHTRADGDIALATDRQWAALEIDGFDSLYHEGWSVLVVGQATHVSDPAELTALQHIQLLPWADEHRSCVIRLPLDDVSGRRLHHTLAAPPNSQSTAPQRDFVPTPTTSLSGQ